ncbi:tRNA1(Val) (adenine(37)-N6)-methyltransferase [Flavilitoribacter nigricans]|uniref:tRNA1(Val) (adenine(37)-N6)-methyltransferase n=1 Tax=Flavilitoribacter nigricans (strain ATCC 23147 / DSM 23189 / NBRC 102662 / NCIMB 1420 / SS-2) TaxID=1122177 RepID=A0A2D0N1Z8_FLAN2|nr:methyltransferase [Flavilitoribacter nigricans]PHN01753.1 tRNA (adenine-N(6)-)-methyltransferase [Flavilitoribacter nigricans DSM 23189 = NBRC 102662]
METKTKDEPFRFRQFAVEQDRCSMKVGTDGVLLGAWAEVNEARHILDIGMGSGLIAIMLAQRNETARIDGVEIDQPSFEQAGTNMARSPWSERLEAFHTSIQDFAQATTTRYDLIVSNPPFFTGGNLSYNQDRNSVRHTVKLPHQDLLSAVRKLLNERGHFAVILPYIEGLRFCELAATYQLYCFRMTEVQSRADRPVERLLLEFGRTKQDRLVEQLVLQANEDQERTAAYRALTEDFYL